MQPSQTVSDTSGSNPDDLNCSYSSAGFTSRPTQQRPTDNVRSSTGLCNVEPVAQSSYESFKKSNDKLEYDSRTFEMKYVSSPVMCSSQSKLHSSQTESSVSKSVSTLSEADISLSLSPITRGLGTVNLDRCVSQSSPGLFEYHSSKINQSLHNLDGYDRNTIDRRNDGVFNAESNERIDEASGVNYEIPTSSSGAIQRSYNNQKVDNCDRRHLPPIANARRLTNMIGRADLIGREERKAERESHQKNTSKENVNHILGQADLTGRLQRVNYRGRNDMSRMGRSLNQSTIDEIDENVTIC